MAQIDLFIDQCTRTRESSKNTYRVVLNRLVQFASGRDIDELTKSDLLGYLNRNVNLPNKPDKLLAPASFNQQMAILKLYYKFLGKNYFKGLKKKKETQKVLEIRQQDIDWMLETCENLRDKVAVSILTDCGFRVGELAKVRVCDVEITANGAIIQCPGGKTGSRRVQGLACTAIVAQWKEQHPHADDPNALFICKLQQNDKPVSSQMIRTMFLHLERRAKLRHPDIRHVHPHALRHWAATQIARKGMSAPVMMARFDLEIHCDGPAVLYN